MLKFLLYAMGGIRKEAAAHCGMRIRACFSSGAPEHVVIMHVQKMMTRQNRIMRIKVSFCHFPFLPPRPAFPFTRKVHVALK